MERHGVSWRAWAVLVSLQLAAVCVDGDFGVGDGVGYGERTSALFIKSQGRSIEDNLVDDDNASSEVMARGKKKKKKLKYLLAVVLGIAIVKGLLIPLALKAMGVLAAKAFLLSKLSLILSAILGFKRLAENSWDRMGQMMMMKDRGEVTEIPFHPVPTEAMYHKYSTDQYWGRDMRSK